MNDLAPLPKTRLCRALRPVGRPDNELERLSRAGLMVLDTEIDQRGNLADAGRDATGEIDSGLEAR